jgi:hypothetical protein
MADEINLQYKQGEPASAAMRAWRDDPPPPIRQAGLNLIDETMETLIYEGRYTDLTEKLINFASLGLYKLFGKAESIWKLTVRFDPEGDYASHVTIIGKVDADTRAALGRMAAERGTILRAGGVPTGP